MALPRYTGARPIDHPGAPKQEPIHLKGKYAIRYDGAIFANNEIINRRTDLEFTDELPQWHLDNIRAAKERDEAEAMARRRHQQEQEDLEALKSARAREAIEREKQRRLDTKPSAEAQDKTAKFLIDNAQDVDSLVKFVEEAYGKKLDRRKSINTLKHEADILRRGVEGE